MQVLNESYVAWWKKWRFREIRLFRPSVLSELDWKCLLLRKKGIEGLKFYIYLKIYTNCKYFVGKKLYAHIMHKYKIKAFAHGEDCSVVYLLTYSLSKGCRSYDWAFLKQCYLNVSYQLALTGVRQHIASVDIPSKLQCVICRLEKEMYKKTP